MPVNKDLFLFVVPDEDFIIFILLQRWHIQSWCHDVSSFSE
jgi:hypothetical protein